MAHLSAEELLAVRDAAEQADLAEPELRPLLFAGVMRAYVQSLPRLAAPLMQLHSDLTRMNGVERLLDGTVPLEAWLANAARMAVAAEPQAALQAALERVSGEAEPEPADGELLELPEAIVHVDDTLDYDFLRLGWEAGAAVARLRVPPFENGSPRLAGGAAAPVHLGTGWLITPELVVTNHHVVAARGAAGQERCSDEDLRLQGAHARAEFGFDADDAEPAVAGFAELAAWGEELDYAVLRLEQPSQRRPLALAPAPLEAVAGERVPVNIIQHPLGEAKRVALRNNLVDRATERTLRYFTDTRSGASGAPVLDDRWRVVALHRASRRVPGVAFQGKPTAVVNVGSAIHAVLDDMRGRHPRVHAEIAAAQAARRP